MLKKASKPIFAGIADPRCRCTLDRLCRLCAPTSPGNYPEMIDYRPDRFRGKFREPWNAAVAKNNDRIKNGGEKP